MIDDDFDFDQPVTRIPQNEQRNKQLGNHILKEAQQYLEAISADEHTFLIQTLNGLAKNEEYFKVLAEQLDQPLGEKVANDALNLLVIPDYNVIVACKGIKYTLLNSAGEELFAAVILRKG